MIPVRSDLEICRERPVPVSWKVPAFCTNDWAALSLADLCASMGVGLPFQVAYGAPACRWAGGRPAAVRQPLTRAQLNAYFDAYDRRGIRVALTLSRLEVSESELNDAYANLLLDMAAAHGAEAIVVDDRLARHIRARHPQIRLIASFNKPLCWLDPHAAPQEETAYYQRLLELYDEVVVRCEYALDNGRIGLLSPEDRERVEVVVNQICVPNCDRGLQHMRALQDWDGSGPCQGCLHLPRAHEAGRRLAGNVLVSNRRIDELAAMGVTKMKLGGRNVPVQWFLDCVGTYVFEPTGAYAAMKDVPGRDFATERERNPRFAQYDLPR